MLVPQDTLRCCCINPDPPIIVTYGNPMAGPAQLAPLLAGRRVYFLAGAWWSYLDLSLLGQTVQVYKAFQAAYPEHQYVFLTNDPEEGGLLDKVGLPHFCCHHNAFIDENLFKPLPRAEKRLDAVYTARLVRLKRHVLARDIPSWGLLYGLGRTGRDKELSYLRHLRRQMPGMELLNGDPETGAYRLFTPEQMCRAYNMAKVGLCLSAVEGGNYAATEYLLSGLPVVSTRSKGGRSAFFDAETSRVVDDDSRAVAEAVAELAARRLPPQFVRLRALVKLKEMREDFIRLVNAILGKEGRPMDFGERFGQVFVHKLYGYPASPEAFVAGLG
jgi:glycosyltransferase involved in cell wall biosynthesis